MCIHTHQVLLFQNLDPLSIQYFLKMNTHPQLIVGDFKILNICY